MAAAAAASGAEQGDPAPAQTETGSEKPSRQPSVMSERHRVEAKSKQKQKARSGRVLNFLVARPFLNIYL